jgi:hypothetical protein
MSVTLHTTSGDLKLELYCDKTPITFKNFLALCAKGYYDNTVFELATSNDNIKLENNRVIGLNAGYFFIDVTKMETAQYSALSKRMSGYVQKLVLRN